MKTQNIYWLTILIAACITLAALCTVGLLFWFHLPLENKAYLQVVARDYFGYFFTAGFVIFLAFGFAADWIFRAYVKPINRMAEQLDLINTVNPDLRVAIRGSYDVRRLGRIINMGVDQIVDLRKRQADGSLQDRFETESEKDILATFMSGMPQGILVCNLKGRIVFYNNKAKELLVAPESQSDSWGKEKIQWIGLGRSVYQFIKRSLVEEAIARMAKMMNEIPQSANERFLLPTSHRGVLPAELMPVFDSQHHVIGFIIYIEDLTTKQKKVEKDVAHFRLWQHQLTQSISIMKTASEILRDETIPSHSEYRELVQILAEQSDLAAQFWTRKEIAAPWSDKVNWPLTPVSVKQWTDHLSKHLIPALEMDVHIEPSALASSISIDIFHLSQSMLSILIKMHEQLNLHKVHTKIYQEESWLYVDMTWTGHGVRDDVLKKWKDDPQVDGSGGHTISVADTLTYHKAKLWPHHHTGKEDEAGLRLLIPTITGPNPARTNGGVTILPESRPGYYDFNLFQQAGRTPEQDKRLLSELTFTVFDTETTGLDPSGGDEIISVGAVRIVNGRLLPKEQFNQLVDPKRHLPWESVKYHGIRPEMLIDQPTIEKVLPNFKRFVQDTILIGHNVAFDMRMLQVKEQITGVKFTNPVLDTMLLSSIVHPAQESHSLSGVAKRFGVDVQGRHTALGDAVATGEIFIKLLPFLAQNNIRTLGEAIDASKKSFYANLKY